MGIIIDVPRVVFSILSLFPLTPCSDSQITFTLQDSDMMKIPVLAKGLKARLFTSAQEEPPPTPSVGDIVLIRNCKVAIINLLSNVFNRVQVSNFRDVPTIGGIKRVTSTVVYQAASIPEPAFKQSFLGEKDIPCLPQDPSPRPSKAEQMYAIDLKQLTPSVINVAGASDATAIPTGPAAGPSHPISVPNRPATGRTSGPLQTNSKFRLIQAVSYNDYCDLAVEVIKKFPNPSGNMELYVTDYTPNDSLYDYPAPDDADAEDELERDGDYYGYISNVTGKRKIWPGPSGRHTMQVELLPPHAGFARDNEGERKLTKKQRKRAKKLGLNTDETTSTSPAVVCNTHGTCVNYDGVRLSTLGDIRSRDHSYTGKSGVAQELSYLNVKNKVRVRVADFWPPRLEDFASLVSTTDASAEDSENDTNTISPFPSQKWEWNFFLLLEDLKSYRPGCPPKQLWVHVDHRYAEFLLCMDEDATDLRRNSQTLAKLREQMAILWGNLEELKAAALAKQQPFPPHDPAPTEIVGLSNLPFYCCIAEYGQKLDEDDFGSEESSGYTRLYDMSGARIFEE
ncbi:unnamed protein product, partial [Aureobasidium vineae]